MAALGQLGTSRREPCSGAAVAITEVGCVHEHILRGPVCERHREALEKGNANCPKCWQDGHVCIVLGRVVGELP